MRTLRTLGTVTNLGAERPLDAIVGAYDRGRIHGHGAGSSRREPGHGSHWPVGAGLAANELGLSIADVMFAS